MQTSDGGRYRGSTSNAYSPNLKRPAATGKKRTALKVALCLLLPPVGLLWIWRTRSFALRGMPPSLTAGGASVANVERGARARSGFACRA